MNAESQKKLKQFAAGHRERLRDRFSERPETFSDTDILELALQYVIPRKDTEPIARLLMGEFGSLSGVLDAEVMNLCETDGMGAASALYVQLLREVVVRFCRTDVPVGIDLSKRSLASQYLRKNMQFRKEEEFHLLSLNSSLRLLKHTVLAVGDADCVNVDVKKLCTSALKAGASRVLVAHNHPSGKVEPSAADDKMTAHMLEAFRVLEIELVDHIIIGRGERYYSYHDQSVYREEFTMPKAKVSEYAPGYIASPVPAFLYD